MRHMTLTTVLIVTMYGRMWEMTTIKIYNHYISDKDYHIIEASLLDSGSMMILDNSKLGKVERSNCIVLQPEEVKQLKELLHA